MTNASVRFGVFEFRPGTGELLRQGKSVRLQAQPARALAALLATPGAVVSRETLQREIWGADTHVDFERGLNFCIAQVRTALRDTADSPRFIETVPRQGYRFIAPVEGTNGSAAAVIDAGTAAAPATDVRPSRRAIALMAFAFVVTTALAAVAWRKASAPVPTVVVIPFYNETGSPDREPLARAIADATVARLASPERLPVLSVIGNAPQLKSPFARSDVQRVAGELRADWVLIGQLKSDAGSLRVIGHLIRAGDMKHVWAQTFDDRAFDLPAQSAVAESIAGAVSHVLSSR